MDIEKFTAKIKMKTGPGYVPITVIQEHDGSYEAVCRELKTQQMKIRAVLMQIDEWEINGIKDLRTPTKSYIDAKELIVKIKKSLEAKE